MLTNRHYIQLIQQSCSDPALSRQKIKQQLEVDTIFVNPKYPEFSDKEVAVGIKVRDTYCIIEIRPMQSDLIKEITGVLNQVRLAYK